MIQSQRSLITDVLDSSVDLDNEFTTPSDAENDNEYRSSPGVAQSDLKLLEVSPYRYWYHRVNPNRPVIEPTPYMRFGTALHCAVLEEDQFERRYACDISKDDFPNCIDTVVELKAWLSARGIKMPSTALKPALIEMVRSISPDAEVWDVMKAEHAQSTRGKIVLSKDDWNRVDRAARSVLSEPRVREILDEEHTEVRLTARDPDTGVLLKGRLDCLQASRTVDIKSFSSKGKTIEKAIADAICYDRYYRQGYFYTWLRMLQPGANPKKTPDFVEVFVESEEPHEVRLKAFRPTVAGQANVYWLQARSETESLLRLYDSYMRTFGVDRPWRSAQEIEPLVDEDVPAFAFKR